MSSINGTRSGAGPAYARIRDHLRKLLGTVEGRLPTEAELMKTFRVSRQTARRAYAELVAEGLVDRAPGKGSFRAQPNKLLIDVSSLDDIMGPSQDREVRVIRSLGLVRNTTAATQLGLISDVVGLVAYQHVYQSRVVGMARVCVPPKVAAILADVDFLHRVGAVSNEYVITMLNRKLEHPIAVARQLVSAMAAPDDVAAAIECQPGQPLLKIEFLYFDTQARPVQWTVNFYNPELYEYRAHLQRRNNSTSNVWETLIDDRLGRPEPLAIP